MVSGGDDDGAPGAPGSDGCYYVESSSSSSPLFATEEDKDARGGGGGVGRHSDPPSPPFGLEGGCDHQPATEASSPKAREKDASSGRPSESSIFPRGASSSAPASMRSVFHHRHPQSRPDESTVAPAAASVAPSPNSTPAVATASASVPYSEFVFLPYASLASAVEEAGRCTGSSGQSGGAPDEVKAQQKIMAAAPGAVLGSVEEGREADSLAEFCGNGRGEGDESAEAADGRRFATDTTAAIACNDWYGYASDEYEYGSDWASFGRAAGSDSQKNNGGCWPNKASSMSSKTPGSGRNAGRGGVPLNAGSAHATAGARAGAGEEGGCWPSRSSANEDSKRKSSTTAIGRGGCGADERLGAHERRLGTSSVATDGGCWPALASSPEKNLAATLQQSVNIDSASGANNNTVVTSNCQGEDRGRCWLHLRQSSSHQHKASATSNATSARYGGLAASNADSVGRTAVVSSNKSAVMETDETPPNSRVAEKGDVHKTNPATDAINVKNWNFANRHSCPSWGLSVGAHDSEKGAPGTFIAEDGAGGVAVPSRSVGGAAGAVHEQASSLRQGSYQHNASAGSSNRKGCWPPSSKYSTSAGSAEPEGFDFGGANGRGGARSNRGFCWPLAASDGGDQTRHGQGEISDDPSGTNGTATRTPHCSDGDGGECLSKATAVASKTERAQHGGDLAANCSEEADGELGSEVMLRSASADPSSLMVTPSFAAGEGEEDREARDWGLQDPVYLDTAAAQHEEEGTRSTPQPVGTGPAINGGDDDGDYFELPPSKGLCGPHWSEMRMSACPSWGFSGGRRYKVNSERTERAQMMIDVPAENKDGDKSTSEESAPVGTNLQETRSASLGELVGAEERDSIPRSLVNDGWNSDTNRTTVGEESLNGRKVEGGSNESSAAHPRPCPASAWCSGFNHQGAVFRKEGRELDKNGPEAREVAAKAADEAAISSQVRLVHEVGRSKGVSSTDAYGSPRDEIFEVPEPSSMAWHRKVVTANCLPARSSCRLALHSKGDGKYGPGQMEEALIIDNGEDEVGDLVSTDDSASANADLEKEKPENEEADMANSHLSGGNGCHSGPAKNDSAPSVHEAANTHGENINPAPGTGGSALATKCLLSLKKDAKDIKSTESQEHRRLMVYSSVDDQAADCSSFPVEDIDKPKILRMHEDEQPQSNAAPSPGVPCWSNDVDSPEHPADEIGYEKGKQRLKCWSFKTNGTTTSRYMRRGMEQNIAKNAKDYPVQVQVKQDLQHLREEAELPITSISTASADNSVRVTASHVSTRGSQPTALRTADASICCSRGTIEKTNRVANVNARSDENTNGKVTTQSDYFEVPPTPFASWKLPDAHCPSLFDSRNAHVVRSASEKDMLLGEEVPQAIIDMENEEQSPTKSEGGAFQCYWASFPRWTRAGMKSSTEKEPLLERLSGDLPSSDEFDEKGALSTTCAYGTISSALSSFSKKHLGVWKMNENCGRGQRNGVIDEEEDEVAVPSATHCSEKDTASTWKKSVWPQSLLKDGSCDMASAAQHHEQEGSREQQEKSAAEEECHGMKKIITVGTFPPEIAVALASVLLLISVLLALTHGGSTICELVGKRRHGLITALVPLVSAISGNYGLQANHLTKLAIEHEHITSANYHNWLRKETTSSFVLGSLISIVVGLSACVLSGNFETLFAVAIALGQFTSFISAGISGTYLPIAFKFKLQRDGGKWTSQIITVLVDVVTAIALLYLAIALLWLDPPFVSPSDECHG